MDKENKEKINQEKEDQTEDHKSLLDLDLDDIEKLIVFSGLLERKF